MRAMLLVVMLLAGFCWFAGTQELKVYEKAPPSDKEIIDLVGSRMSKAFAKFGYPQDLVPTDVSSDDPEVMLDYGSYGFKIEDKVLDCCIFFSNWKGTVYGASIGDMQDDVVKKLGQPTSSDKDSDGLPYLVWTFKDQDGYLMINFDKDNKMNRAVVNAEQLNKETTMRVSRNFSGFLIISALMFGPLTVFSMISVTNAVAQELAHSEKPLPTVDEIAAMLGQPLANVFTKYGAPSDVFVTGADTKTPSVIADYSKFGFEIRDKKVTECEFWLGWPGPVMGAKIGDMADDIVKAMGQPAEDIKNADGTELMEWPSSDKKMKISIAFNKKRKSTGLILEPQ